MDLEIIILSEVKSDREGEIYAIVYMWNLKKKKVQLNLFTKQSHQCSRKQTCGYQGMGVGG